MADEPIAPPPAPVPAASTAPAMPAPTPADTVTLVGGNGKFYDFPAENAGSALKQGFRAPTAAELHQQELKKTFGEGALPAVGAAAAGAARTLSFGLSDQVAKKLGPDAVESLAALKKYQPGATSVGEFGSLLIPILGDLGYLGAVGKAAGAPLRLIGQGAAKVGQGAGSLAGYAATAAAENAAFQVGQNISSAALQDRELGAESIMANVGEAALLGGAFGVALPVGGKIARLSLDKARQGASRLGDSIFALAEGRADDIGAAVAGAGRRTADLVESAGAQTADFVGETAADAIGATQARARKFVEDQLPGIKAKLAEGTGRADIIDEAFAKPFTEEGLASRDTLLKSGVSSTREKFAEGFTKDLQQNYDQILEAQPLLNDIKHQAQQARLTADAPQFAARAHAAIIEQAAAVGENIGKYSTSFGTKFDDIMAAFRKKTAATPEGAIGARIGKAPPAAKDPGVLFEAIDELKQDLDKLAKFERGTLPTSSEGFAADEVRKFREGLRNILVDERMGGAGAIQERYNELYSAHMRNKKALEETFMVRGGASKAFGEKLRVDSKKVRSFVRDIDQPQADTAKEVLQRFHESSRALLDEVETYREATTKVLQADSIRAGQQGAQIRLADAEKQLETLRVLSGHEQTLGNLEVQGLRRADLGPALSKFAIGGIAGGKFGLAVAAALERYGAITTNPVAALKALTFMERMTLASKREIADGVAATVRGKSQGAADFLRKASEGAEPVVAEAVRKGAQAGRRGVAAIDAGAERATQRLAERSDRIYRQALTRVAPVEALSTSKERPAPTWFERTQSRLARAVAAPDRVVAELRQEMKAVFDQDPQLGEELLQRRMQLYSYLYQAMPKQPGGAYMAGSKWQPTATQVMRFERTYRTATEPLTIFADVSRGTATRDQVKALQTLYPRIFQELVGKVQDALDTTPNVSHATKLRLGQLLGVPVTYSQTPGFRAVMQSATAPQADQQGGGPPADVAKLNPKAYMSESQRVANR